MLCLICVFDKFCGGGDFNGDEVFLSAILVCFIFEEH